MTGNRDIEVAREYHRTTNHSQASLRADAHHLDFSNQPLPFKIYTDLEPISLPTDIASTGVPALQAISLVSDDGDDVEHVPTLSELARVLYLAAGVLRRRTHAGGESFFRAYANTGALYHIDLYLVCQDLPNLPAGVYHFSPHDFALRRLRAGDHRAVLVDASGGEARVATAPVIVVSASTYWRNAWKYRARTYRHCFWDTGTLHANLLAVAATGKLRPRVVVGFADRPVEHLLALDPKREGALTMVALGRTDSKASAAPRMPDLELETRALSERETDYPRVREMHKASALARGEEAALWRSSAAPAGVVAPASGPVFALDHGVGPGTRTLEQAVVRRGSTRRFDRQFALSFAQLSAVLRCAMGPLAADFLCDPLAALVELYLIVHNVSGLPGGAYYYRAGEGELELLKAGDFRSTAGRLGLFQDLAAEAAVNVYVLTDLERVLESFGNRGYRAAQLEGGIRGGRMYLAAYAQRFGATGLTFLDDEVIDFFSPHATGKTVMFLSALGRSIRQRARAQD